jgi:hypothetical protein
MHPRQDTPLIPQILFKNITSILLMSILFLLCLANDPRLPDLLSLSSNTTAPYWKRGSGVSQGGHAPANDDAQQAQRPYSHELRLSC